MKTKNFLVSGFAGSIVYFLLGWLFYAYLFKEIFPPSPNEGSENLLVIYLGCLTFGLFVAYIYTNWAQISTLATGALAGGLIGFFLGLYWNFFYLAMFPETTYTVFGVDLAIQIVSGAITGAVIAMVHGKMAD